MPMVSFFGTETTPSSGDSSPTIMPEERRLAGAVRPDQPGLLARIELERGVDEEDLPPVLLADVGERDHAVGRTRRPRSIFRIAEM